MYLLNCVCLAALHGAEPPLPLLKPAWTAKIVKGALDMIECGEKLAFIGTSRIEIRTAKTGAFECAFTIDSSPGEMPLTAGTHDFMLVEPIGPRSEISVYDLRSHNRRRVTRQEDTRLEGALQLGEDLLIATSQKAGELRRLGLIDLDKGTIDYHLQPQLLRKLDKKYYPLGNAIYVVNNQGTKAAYVGTIRMWPGAIDGRLPAKIWGLNGNRFLATTYLESRTATDALEGLGMKWFTMTLYEVSELIGSDAVARWTVFYNTVCPRPPVTTVPVSRTITEFEGGVAFNIPHSDSLLWTGELSIAPMTGYRCIFSVRGKTYGLKWVRGRCEIWNVKTLRSTMLCGLAEPVTSEPPFDVWPTKDGVILVSESEGHGEYVSVCRFYRLTT